MEPVEIDILLNQNVDREGDKATQALNNLSNASEKSRRDLAQTIELQRIAIAKLKAELEPLAKAFAEVNVGTHDPKLLATREELSKAVRKLRYELKDEEQALIELEKQYGKISDKQTTLLTQMRNVRNEMFQLKQSGQQETEMYREKEEQLRILATAHRQLTEEQKALARGGAQMQGFLSGLSALTGLLSAGGGALGLFNTNTEEFVKIQTRVQSLMAITIGLQQVQNTLHKTSAFRIHTVTKAKQAWAAANMKVATTLGITTVAAQVLMASLTLGLSAAIGAVITAASKLIEKQKATRAEQQKLTDAIANSSSSQIASYEAVRISYNKLGSDIKAKEKFIADNQDEFKKLGVAIDTVNDADNAFIYNTEAFKAAIMARAKASAAMEIAAEKYKEALKKQASADDQKIKAFSLVEKVTDEDGTERYITRKAMKLREEAKKLEQEANAMVGKAVDSSNEANHILANAGIRQVEKKVKETKEVFESQSGELERAFEKLAKMSGDLQKETDAAVVAAMEDGLEKRVAQIDNEYKQRKKLIEQRLKEIEEIEETHGIDASKQKKQLQALADAEKQRYDQTTKSALAGAKSALDGVWNEINARFNTESQNRLNQIEQFYAEQIAKARANGATEKKIDEINLQRKRDVELEKQFISLETLELEAQIEIKRAALQDRRVMLASQREEKILKITIEATKKRLAKLRDIEATGGDVAKQIAELTYEIEAMNAALAQTSVKKLQEMGSYMQQILDGVGDFATIFDEDLGGLFDMASGAVGGITALRMGIASGNPQQIIEGAMKLLDTAGKIIRASKEANAEIKEFNYSFAQQAIDYSLAVIRAIKDVKSETDNIFTDNYTHTLVQGMAGYSSAIDKQAELMNKLGQATIKTGVEKKKFLGITYGTKDVYSSLLKTYPNLINKDGELNRELAETLKASGNLNKDAQDLIDNILKASDAANEAMQAVESELQNLVGSIGTELKKALDDAFAGGIDSAAAMTDSVVSMLRDIGTQKMFTAVFGGLFSQLEDRMKKSFGTSGDRDLADDINWFVNEYGQYVEEYNKGLAQLQEAIKEQYGTDPFAGGDGRSAVAKGIAQASQDSIDELSGRITFLVMKVNDIVSLNSENNNYNKEQLLVNRAMLGELEVIAENSYFLRNLANIREDIDKMVREGIIMKR